jgi:hypothetical protein
VPNIEINTTGQIHPQLFRAAAVIQRNCSTGIEAGLAGVPTLSHTWIPTSIPIPSVEAVSVPCHSYAEMQEKLDVILAGQYRPSETVQTAIDQVVADWFYRIDGQAHRRVAETVLRHLDGARRADRRRCRYHLYGLRAVQQPMTRQASRWLRYALGLSPDWSFTRMRVVDEGSLEGSAKYFGAQEVRQFLELLQATAGPPTGAARGITVALAREHGDYVHKPWGHSVRLAC